jgi:hypothetical protein
MSRDEMLVVEIFARQKYLLKYFEDKNIGRWNVTGWNVVAPFSCFIVNRSQSVVLRRTYAQSGKASRADIEARVVAVCKAFDKITADKVAAPAFSVFVLISTFFCSNVDDVDDATGGAQLQPRLPRRHSND